MITCNACPGFVPGGMDRCPHCGALAPRSKLATLATAVAGGLAMVTLMACYGMVDEPCGSDAECTPGRCNFDTGFCIPFVEQCSNGIDDDQDGLVDCNDPDCHGECATSEGNCSDGFDNDHDGFVDCSDPDCVTACSHETACQNGFDDDGDGLVDCSDPDCAASCGIHESSCFDGLDNDGDGLVDCSDADCQGQCTGHEGNCNNGVDDDLDGLADCSDPDCVDQAVCGGHELDCSNGIDDDHDGLVDCLDLDCPACSAVETDCQNGFDDDLDGLADCADPDCAAICAGTCGDGVLGAAETCDDGNLNDGDGCSASCVIETATYCDALPTLPLGGVAGSTATGATNAFGSTCTAAGGPERGYRFLAPSNGTLYLSLDAPTDLGITVELGCGAFSSELGCSNAVPQNQLETLSLTVPAGAPLTVFVDGASPATAGSFVLIADFVPAP